MVIGATPTHIFNIPEDISIFTEIEITYKQSGEIKLQKYMTKDKLQVVDSTLVVKLTQEETFLFDQKAGIAIQLRFVAASGDVIPSEVIYDTPTQCLSEVVL